MTIKFKTIKYKHQKQAQEIQERRKSKQATDDEMNLFILSLVAEWDLTDADTGEPLVLNGNLQAILDELSLQQYADLTKAFNEAMDVLVVAVPKQNALQSPSGSTKSRAKRKSQYNSPNG